MITKSLKNILTLFIGIILIIASSCSQSSTEPKKFVSNFVEVINSYESIQYKISAEKYSNNSLDTSVTTYEIWIVRKQGHRKRNGFIWLNNNYRPYSKIYDNGTMWRTNPTKNTTTQFSNFKDSFIATCDYIDLFLDPLDFRNQITNSNNKVSITDTVFQRIKSKRIIVEYPTNEEGEKNSIEYIIDRNTYTPIWAMMRRKSDENTLIIKLSFSDITIDGLNIKTLQKKHKELIETYPIETNNSSSKNSLLNSMLKVGEDAPLFNGNFYSSQKPFNLEDYLGKNIIVLDFWYSHCPPCIKAIPEISELNNLFKDKGVKVFGINSIDNKPQSIDYLETFTDRRTISYDIILVDSSVDLMYKIQRYPSVYVIGLDGTISIVELGYHKGSVEELTTRIKALL